jgi:hypothetical protein
MSPVHSPHLMLCILLLGYRFAHQKHYGDADLIDSKNFGTSKIYDLPLIRRKDRLNQRFPSYLKILFIRA